MFPPGLVFKSLHQQVTVERCPLIVQVWPYDQCPEGDLISAKEGGPLTSQAVDTLVLRAK